MLEIRPVAGYEELEGCYDLWDAVFPDGRAFFQERLAYDRTYHLETTWVAVMDGVLAAAQQIFPYRARYRDVVVTVGGVGNVATLPSFRHRGLAQALLGRQMAWMRAERFDVGLLFTGIPDFYRQLGWHSVTLGVELKLPRSRVFAADSSRDPTIDIRPADLDGEDLVALLDLYQRDNATRPWTRIRDLDYWTDLKRWTHQERLQVWLACAQSEFIAYLIVRPRTSTPAALVECGLRPGYDPSLSGPLGALLRKLWTLVELGDELPAALPANHPLIGAGVQVRPHPGAMATVFHSQSILEASAARVTRENYRGLEADLACRLFVDPEPGFLWPLDHF